MVSQTAIAVTTLLQMWGKSFFVDQSKFDCSPAPALGGTIFLLAMLLLMWDCNLLPPHYRQRAPWVFAVAEVVATVFVTELIIQLGWATYERIAYRVVSLVCHKKVWCELGLMTAITVVGAFASLCIVVEVVCPARVRDSLGEVLENLPVPEVAGPMVHYFQDVRCYLMGAIYFSQLTREQRLLAVRAFELQARRSETTQEEQSEEQLENLEQEEQSEEEVENLEHEQTEEEQENLEQDEQSEEQSEEQQENPKQETQDLLVLQDLPAVGKQMTEPEPEPVEESTA